MSNVHPIPENQPGTKTFITVEQEANNILTALDAANDAWNADPDAADYYIQVKILGIEYPLFINAVDVADQLRTAIDDIRAIAAENQW